MANPKAGNFSWKKETRQLAEIWGEKIIICSSSIVTIEETKKCSALHQRHIYLQSRYLKSIYGINLHAFRKQLSYSRSILFLGKVLYKNKEISTKGLNFLNLFCCFALFVAIMLPNSRTSWHVFMKLENSGRKGLWETSSPRPHSKQGVTLEITPSSSRHYLVGAFKRTESTTSLGNLLNCLTVLKVKMLLLYSVWTSIVSTYILSSNHVLLWMVWSTFSSSPHRYHQAALRPLKAFSSSLLQTEWDQRCSSHQYPLIRLILQLSPTLGPLTPYMPRNVLQEDLLHDFPKDWSDAD